MVPVVMAGGAGTRFWPASRAARPKQFLKFWGSSSLLEQTIDRLLPLPDRRPVLVVTGQQHAPQVSQLLPDKDVWVLDEPEGRNTAACIALAATHVLQRFGDLPCFFLPADHFVGDDLAMRRDLTVAAKMARQEDVIVTVGVRPTGPETRYGYLRVGEHYGSVEGTTFLSVEEFVEKPNLERASAFVREGTYLWNAGMFVVRPSVVMEEFRRLNPPIYEAFLELAPHVGNSGYREALAECYGKLPVISFDYAVMERTQRRTLAIAASFPWSDVGTWGALYELQRDSWDGNRNLTWGLAHVSESEGTFVSSNSSRFVCALGVKDMLIVDSEDVVLVCPLGRAEEVGRLAKEVEEGHGPKWV